MTVKLRDMPRAGKSADAGIRNPNSGIAKSISPVMQKVKDLLKDKKPAWELHCLTAVPLSTCQKLCSGEMSENAALLTSLLRSWMGRDILMVLLDGCEEDWIVRYRKQLDINAARKQLRDSQRAIEALQAEVEGP